LGGWERTSANPARESTAGPLPIFCFEKRGGANSVQKNRGTFVKTSERYDSKRGGKGEGDFTGTHS